MMAAAAKGKSRANGNRGQRRFTRTSTVLLRFDDPELDGLEVRTRRVSLGDAFDLMEMAEGIDSEGGMGDRAHLEAFLGAVVDKVLLSWNVDNELLDDEGVPTGETAEVPLSVDGLMTLDLAFVMSIFNAWAENVIGVSGPLAQRSPGGSPSAVPSLPMEPLSPSQPS